MENAASDLRSPAPTGTTRSGRFLGFVSDYRGSPIPGARVSIRAVGPHSPAGAPCVGTTDKDGQFVFYMDVGDATGFALEAEAEGYSKRRLEGTGVAPERPLSVKLAIAFQLRITVRDAESRAPLAGVETFVDGKRSSSDADGHVEVSAFASDRAISVRTRVAGYANEEKEVLVSGPGDRSVDVELHRATEIEVEVVDVDSGEPLSNVAVRDPFHGNDEYRTDAAGRFKTSVTPEHELPVLLSCDGYWRLSWTWAPESVDRSRRIQLPMKRKTFIHGRITDTTGAPVSGASVDLRGKDRVTENQLSSEEQARWRPPGHVSYELTLKHSEVPPSDADGLYRVALPPDTSTPALNVRCKGFVPFERDPFLLADQTPADSIDVVLHRAATIRGRVISNAPREGQALITARDASQRIVGSAGIYGPTKMTYVLDSLPEGDVHLSLEHGTSRVPIAAIDVRVQAGQTLEQDLTWPEDPPVKKGTIKGRVVSAGGALPPDVSVYAYPIEPASNRTEPATLGTDGSFEVHVPVGVSYQLRASTRIPRNASSEPRVATADESDVELRLPQVGTLCVRLLDAVTGAPISPSHSEQYGAMRIRRRSEPSWETRSMVIDLDGRSCVELPLGEYDLGIQLAGEGYLPAVLEKVSPTLDAEAPAHELRLTRGIDVRVRLAGPADASGQPPGSRVVFLLERSQLASVEGPLPPGDPRANQEYGGDHGVRLRIDDDDVRSQSLDGEKYWFDGATMRGLRAGHYSVKAFPDDLQFVPSEFEVKGPGRTDVVIAWRPK